jgi:hypothetical protein
MAAKNRKEHTMEKLYPIIRRVRRPLLPPEEVPPSPQPSSVSSFAETSSAAPGEGETPAAIGASEPDVSSSGSENEINMGGDVEKRLEGSEGVAVDLPLLGGEGRGEGERSSNPPLRIDKGKSRRRKEKVPDAPQAPAT